MDLEFASRFEGSRVVDHIEDEGAAGAHLDLADIEAEVEELLQEGSLPIRLTTNHHNLWDGKLLSELHLQLHRHYHDSCYRRNRGRTAGGEVRGPAAPSCALGST
jgi:hypothetical protein